MEETTYLDGVEQTTTFHSDLVVGKPVRYSYTMVESSADSVDAVLGSGSGIYVGVALDEEDGIPYRYFILGEICGVEQESFGFPAPPDTPVTTSLTPTSLIQAAL